MKKFMFLALVAVAAISIAAGTPSANAQVNVSIGVAPACPYGYYDYTPYNCAPYGYYGPEWFHGHTFIGVGPWFHGRNDFHGHVDNNFDPHHGYNGRMPEHGEKNNYHTNYPKHFKGNEMRDGREHAEEHHHDEGDKH